MVKWGKSYAKRMAKYEKDPKYIKVKYIDEFTEEVCRLMEEQNISRKQLAERMNTSPAYITKILRGNVNFTFETIAKIACALNADFRFSFCENTGTETVVRFPYRSAAHIDYKTANRPLIVSEVIKDWTDNEKAAGFATCPEVVDAS